jgi:hypothetical protein
VLLDVAATSVELMPVACAGISWEDTSVASELVLAGVSGAETDGSSSLESCCCRPATRMAVDARGGSRLFGATPLGTPAVCVCVCVCVCVTVIIYVSARTCLFWMGLDVCFHVKENEREMTVLYSMCKM